jgi:hypothetical protein
MGLGRSRLTPTRLDAQPDGPHQSTYDNQTSHEGAEHPNCRIRQGYFPGCRFHG